MIRHLAAALAVTALLAGSARADLLSLNWNSCAETFSDPVQTFACDANSGGTFDLIFSMNPFTPMSEVYRAAAHFWIQTSAATLPSWWQLQPGGCRAGALSVDPAGPYPPGCADAWLGAATVTAEVAYNECQPGGLRVSVTAILPPGTTRSLTPGTRYAMFRLRIDRRLTTDTGSCGGCATPACIGVSGLTVYNTSGQGWSMSPAYYAEWQNSSAPCGLGGPCSPTEAAPRTWGSIKSLYH